MPNKCPCTVYVDDLVLIADEPDTLDKLLLTLNQWFSENRMCINPEKTKIIHFTQAKKQKCNMQQGLY